MTRMESSARLGIKTPAAAFDHVLQQEFGFAPRIARAVLTTAQEMLIGETPRSHVQPGQIRLVVASLQAPFGPPLADTDMVTVTLTVDAGAEDQTLKAALGAEGLRRAQIMRLTEEALAQDGVLTQEDLARALQVSPRTIRRSVRALKAEGNIVPTRGEIQGVGRGQTHKVQIITLWLNRTSYPQIMRQTYHSQQSIQRYISTFLRMVVLHERGWTEQEISFLTRSSVHLVQEYLRVYQKAQQDPAQRTKLEAELARVSGGEATTPPTAEKGGLR